MTSRFSQPNKQGPGNNPTKENKPATHKKQDLTRKQGHNNLKRNKQWGGFRQRNKTQVKDIN